MRKIVSLVGLMVGVGVLTPVFAESAPVYDADAMQQQFDAASQPPDANQASLNEENNLPPPPPPGQENVFVPTGVEASAPPAQIAPVPVPSATPLTLSDRLKRVEQQMTGLQSRSASSSRIETLQSEIQTLRGQVEQLTHQLQQLQAQIKTQYADLDKRLSQAATTSVNTTGATDDVLTSTKSASKGVSAAKATKIAKVVTDDGLADEAKSESAEKPAQPNVAEEQQLYQTAYDMIKAKKYNEAVAALQGMLKKYPSGQFAANAHYWLGELYGLMGKSEPALKEFNTVVKSYPSSPRISDAQLKVGLIYASQSKWSDAKDAFKKVINHFPGTASSRLAAEQLKQIKQAGN